MNAVSGGNDPATERLNYRNGQRIEASDLRVEQAYHIAVRRWLNRSLYTAGIAKGLEVNKNPANPHTVIVSPGLALDIGGREIILPSPVEVWATGTPSSSPGVVFGNFLVIEYGEERTGPGDVECSPGQSAPTRIRATPRLSIQDAWPTLDSGKIPLAQIELESGCEVADLHLGVRKYIAASKPPKARAISIEGEKDINPANPKAFTFHVTGGTPDTVTLYLQASKFSTLYYTEMATHTHAVNLTTGQSGQADGHRHNLNLGDIATTAVNDHRHEIFAATQDDGGAIELGNPSGGQGHQMLTGPGGTTGGSATMEVMPAGGHSHTLSMGTVQTEPAGAAGAHTHPVAGATGAVGQTGAAARAGTMYQFFQGLMVWLDKSNVTDKILDQIAAKSPTPGEWTSLGNGLPSHPFVQFGSGEIDLLQLGQPLGPGPHTLEFVPTAGGGQIRYNLYIE